MTTTTSPSARPKKDASPVVVDLGRKKRKRIKLLRDGRGPLVDDVHVAVENLKCQGTIDDQAQIVIVVVREKRRGQQWCGMWT